MIYLKKNELSISKNPPPPGGGGHSAHILVGMCHGEVKNVGLWSGSSVKMLVSGAGSSGLERENVGLWSGLKREIGALWSRENNVQKTTNVQTPTFVQTFRPQMCKQPHLCKHGVLKCANL